MAFLIKNGFRSVIGFTQHGPGENEIQAGQDPEVVCDIFIFCSSSVAELCKDRFNGFLFLKLQFPQLIVEFDNGHGLNEKRRAGRGLVMDHTWYLTFVFCFDRNAVAAVSHSDHGILKIASRGTVDQRGQLCVDAVVGLADGAADPGKSRACIICDFIFGQDTAVDLIVETGQRLKIVKHVIQGIFFTVGILQPAKRFHP